MVLANQTHVYAFCERCILTGGRILGKKLNSVYGTMILGISEGLSGSALYDYVTQNCRDASEKRIRRASLLALADDRVKDRAILEHIYQLAVHSRFNAMSQSA